MKNNRNKSLFWYGFFAGVKQFIGILMIFISLILGLVGLAEQATGLIIVFLIMFILGIVLFFKGKSQRFDYKQQSGSMLHKGDW